MMEQSATRVGYIGVPAAEGITSVYETLRPGLAAKGYDLRLLHMGPDADASGSAVVDGYLPFTLEGNDPQQWVDRVVDQLDRHNIRMVVFNSGKGHFQTNLARYLPNRFRSVFIAHTMTRGAYAPASELSGHVDRIVGVSPRVADDLLRQWRLPPEQVVCIVNGIDTSCPPERPAVFSRPPVKLLFLGRMTELPKGLVWLPDILRRLLRSGLNVRLTLAGAGPDEPMLRRRVRRLGLDEHVEWLGEVPRTKVLRVMAEHDVFLLTSRFEGCSVALLEAMLCGCVPVASHIHKVTDMMLDDGRCGRLCPVGDTAAFARAVKDLTMDAGGARRISQLARQRVCACFSAEKMAAAYATLFGEVFREPSRSREPLDVADYRELASMKASLRSHLPTPLKALLRTCLERFGRSV